MSGSGMIEELAKRLEANIEPRLGQFEEQIQQLRRELKTATAEIATSLASSGSSQNGSSPGPKLAALKMATVAVQSQTSQPSALQALADQSAQFAPRVVLMVIKGTNALGWIGYGFVDSITGGIRNLMVALGADTIIRDVVRTQSALISSPDKYKESNVLLDRLGSVTPKSIAAVPLMVRGKVAGVLYADSGKSGEICLEALEIMVAACGLTLEIILLGGRKESSSSVPAPTTFSSMPPTAPSPTLSATQQIPQPIPQPVPQPIPQPVPQSVSQTPPLKPVAATPRFEAPATNGRPPSANSIFAPSNSLPYDPSALPDTSEAKGTTEVEEAQRIARLLVQELVLYNQQALVEGRQKQDIYNRLRDDIDRSRAAYDRRVSPKVSEDFFYAEMISVLGEGDPSRLGANCPGPRGSA